MFAKGKFKSSLTLFLIFLVAEVNCAKITVEQMKQATEPIRMVCIQKSKVSEDLLESLREGKLPDEKELKCYVSCVLEMMQMVRKKMQAI